MDDVTEDIPTSSEVLDQVNNDPLINDPVSNDSCDADAATPDTPIINTVVNSGIFMDDVTEDISASLVVEGQTNDDTDAGASFPEIPTSQTVEHDVVLEPTIPSSSPIEMPEMPEAELEDVDVEVPASDDIAVPASHEITQSPREKENPFNRFSESESNDVTTAPPKEPSTQEFPEIEDVDLSTPMTVDPIPAPAKIVDKPSPMVVSVGTIEVNGSNHYEDINIMSKGKVVKAEPETVDESANENKSEDYESLRDIRFSSISMYDKPHFEEDILITVDDAQKHAAESFVSYKVVTKTTREAFQQQEFHVRRRYQDFHWLAKILTQQYPNHIIPPLPQKKAFNRYDPNFLRLRQLALNKFLRRIAEHPILSTSEHFFAFLSAKQVELIEQKKTTVIKRFSIPQIPIYDIVDSPFINTSEYCEEFGKILSSLSSHSTKLQKEQGEQIQALRTLPPSLALWANSEVSNIVSVTFCLVQI